MPRGPPTHQWLSHFSRPQNYLLQQVDFKLMNRILVYFRPSVGTETDEQTFRVQPWYLPENGSRLKHFVDFITGLGCLSIKSGSRGAGSQGDRHGPLCIHSSLASYSVPTWIGGLCTILLPQSDRVSLKRGHLEHSHCSGCRKEQLVLTLLSLTKMYDSV